MCQITQGCGLANASGADPEGDDVLGITAAALCIEGDGAADGGAGDGGGLRYFHGAFLWLINYADNSAVIAP